MSRGSWLLWASAALLPACGGDGIPSDEELLAAYPGGSLFISIETREMQVDDPAPGFLRGDGKLEGHGIEVPLPEQLNPDGSRPVHKWGPWVTYYLNERFEGVAKESLGEFRDGHREGRWTFWHRNGRIRARGTITNSLMTGHWDCWLENGSSDREHTAEYRSGQKVGE